jgi:hypothetical protein
MSDSPRVEHGNLHPEEYKDPATAKNTPTKPCVDEHGANLYATDGCTVKWDATKPHVSPARQR